MGKFTGRSFENSLCGGLSDAEWGKGRSGGSSQPWQGSVPGSPVSFHTLRSPPVLFYQLVTRDPPPRVAEGRDSSAVMGEGMGPGYCPGSV